MFTGIIEEMGTVLGIQKNTRSAILHIQAKKIMDDVKLGDSIAVNGVCLTVTKLETDGFYADVMPETMRRSSLGVLSIGSHVNLERAMAAAGRFGGHIVSGHIDTTGTVQDIKREENAVWYTISTTEQSMKYIIEKGSIAIDGISLTVAACTKDSFQVSIIPHTLQETVLKERKKGDIVNLEHDVVGKYIAHFLEYKEPEKSGLSMDFLTMHGYV